MIKKSLSAVLSESVSDFMEASKPMGVRVNDGHYSCSFGGVDINTANEEQMVEGEPSITVTMVWITTAPIVGKQLRLSYNLSRKDKNGNPWMLKNLWDDLHALGVYSADFEFDREGELTPEFLSELLDRLADSELPTVTITYKTRWYTKKVANQETQASVQERYIDVPLTPQFLEDAGPGVGATGGTGDTAPPFVPGDKVMYGDKELIVVGYDDISDELTVKKPTGKSTSVVKAADVKKV